MTKCLVILFIMTFFTNILSSIIFTDILGLNKLKLQVTRMSVLLIQSDLTNSIFKSCSLLNWGPWVLKTWSCANVLFVLTCLACLCAHVPMCLACLHANVPCMPTWPHANVVTCSQALRTYMLPCQRAVRAYILTCQCTLCPYMLTCQHAIHAYVLMCQHTSFDATIFSFAAIVAEVVNAVGKV